VAGFLDMQNDIVVGQKIGCPLRKYAAGDGRALYADTEISGFAVASPHGLYRDVGVAGSVGQQGTDTSRETERPEGSHHLRRKVSLPHRHA
jgi:hypothetical protein